MEGGTSRAPLSLRPATCEQNALGETLSALGLGRRKGPLKKLPLKREVAGTGGGGQSGAAHLNSPVNYLTGHGRGYHFNHGNLQGCSLQEKVELEEQRTWQEDNTKPN